MTAKRKIMITGKAVFLLLSCYCANQAWAGIPYYQGMLCLKNGEAVKAAGYFAQARRRGEVSAAFDFASGQALWLEGIKTERLESFEKAEAAFERAVAKFPGFGKAHMYLALSKYKLATHSSLTQEKWNAIYSEMLQAEALAPGNRWIAYQAAVVSLSHDRFLSAKEQQHAIQGLKSSVSIEPKRYLKPALAFLWKRYQNPKALQKITPYNYQSYSTLLDFLSSSGISQSWQSTYNAYTRLKLEEYVKLCRLGEYWLVRKPALAEKFFKAAFWIDPVSSWAKAGLLILNSTNLDKTLGKNGKKQFLEKMLVEEEAVGELLPRLEPVVAQTEDAYLQGVYACRLGRWDEAVRFLRASEHGRYRQYYLAASLSGQGKQAEAKTNLFSSLNAPKPDLRELNLLSDLDPSLTPKIEAKIKKYARMRLSSSLWQNEEGMRNQILPGEKVGMKIILLPGVARLFISLKNSHSDFPAFLYVRLGDKVLNAVSLKGEGWRTYSFETTASGGEYWLNLELFAGELSTVEAGFVQINHVSLKTKRETIL